MNRGFQIVQKPIGLEGWIKGSAGCRSIAIPDCSYAPPSSARWRRRANDPRLSRRPTEGRPVSSKRRLGRQSLPSEAPQAIRPTPLPAPRWPACDPRDGRPLSLRPLNASGDSGWAYPPPANFPPPGASFKAPTSRLPAVPAACSTVHYPTSPRLH